MNGEILENWEIYLLPLNNTARIPWDSIETNYHATNGIPSFYFGEFSANEVNDTFMKTSLFTKVSNFFL